MNNTIFPPVPVLKEQAKAALRQAGPAMTKASLVYIGITLIVNYALQGTAPEGYSTICRGLRYGSTYHSTSSG